WMWTPRCLRYSRAHEPLGRCRLHTVMWPGPWDIVKACRITSVLPGPGARPTRIVLSAGCCAPRVYRWMFRVFTASVTLPRAATPGANSIPVCAAASDVWSQPSRADFLPSQHLQARGSALLEPGPVGVA